MELQTTQNSHTNSVSTVTTVSQVSVVPFIFKVPSKRLIKPKKVLTEDEFSQSIGKIIERDFFPDLPNLEAQTEYYEALEKNDLVKLREIQMRFKRPDTGSSDILGSPLTFETPVGRRKTTPAKRKQTDLIHSGASESSEPAEIDEIAEAADKQDRRTSMLSLDSFLARNTSEDSASFAEILKESDRKHRLKHAWIFEKEKEQLAEHENFIALPPIEEQAAITDRPAHINTWKYTNENAVMYVPDGQELSAKEMIEEQKYKPQQIVHENTRFQYNPFNNARSKEAMQKAASFKALINQGKIGHDGKEIQPSQSPQVNGYGFVATPSPAPGVTESPLMTWGEIESTPARLDSNEAMPALTPGPVFRIPAVPKRDRIALELSEKASKAHRAKKEEAIRQVTRRFASPSPSAKIGLSSTERLNSMSPAAQKLASKRLGIKTSTDKALLASYTPTPSPTHRDKTPIRLTPGSRRSQGSLPGSPAIRTPSSQRGSDTPSSTAGSEIPSLTDHLLNLPKRKRKTASDFF
ncbi:protein DGCR14 [Biomphalaria glabrata]|nr:protein DGCR14 [Biomphalaria glabrata]